MKSKMIIYIFWVLCISDIVVNSFNIGALHYAIKPLLMQWLVYLYISETKNAKELIHRLMIFGLLFCWMGDVLLMFEPFNPIFFILGLASFLCGHIFYIFYFSKLPSAPQKIPQRNLLMLLPVAIYVFLLLYLLYPTLGDMKIPVIVYGLVIATMLSMALWQGQKIDRKTALIFLAGATSFVISDSILAINKFYHPFSQSVFSIMFTYCLAQYLIVMGGIKMYRKNFATSQSS